MGNAIIVTMHIHIEVTAIGSVYVQIRDEHTVESTVCYANWGHALGDMGKWLSVINVPIRVIHR